MIAFSNNGALIGTLEDLSLGTKSSEKRTSISCALLPEKDVEGPPLQFYELYDKRNVAYKNTNLAKITSEQLANFQLLVRMDIQFLSSVDVEWKEPEEGVASSQASHGEKKADSAGGEGDKAGDETQELLQASQTLSILHANAPRPAATAAGSIARKEERLLRFALHTSALYGKGFDASLPSAGSHESSSVSAEHDFYDICKWDYRPGHFPLTPEGHKVEPQDQFKGGEGAK